MNKLQTFKETKASWDGGFNTDTIKGRYIRFNYRVVSQSIAENKSTIAWEFVGAGGGGYVVCGDFKVKINGVTAYSSTTRRKIYNGTEIATGTLEIKHSTDGTKTFSASTEAAIYYKAVNARGNDSFALPKIPRAAQLTDAQNFTDIENPTIKYTNPAGENVQSLEACITVDSIQLEADYRAVSKTGNSYTFYLTDDERNKLLLKAANKNEITLKFYLRTRIGNENFYSALERKMKVVQALPSITNPTYKDTNAATVAITANNQQIIRNKSNLQLKVDKVEALKKSSLVSLTATINGISKSFSNISGSVASNLVLDFGTINVASNAEVKFQLKDSRGNTTEVIKQIEILDYKNPYATISVSRKNNYYSESYLYVDCTFSSVDNKNDVTIKYQYKDSATENFNELQPINNKETKVLNLDNNSSWDFQIVITDRLGTTVTIKNIFLDRGIPLIFKDRLNYSVGINCFPKKKKALEVEGDLILNGRSIVDFFYPVGSLYWNSNLVDPNELFGGEWVRIKDVFILAAGEKYTSGSTGGEAEHQLTIEELPKHSFSGTTAEAGSHNHKLGGESAKLPSGSTYAKPRGYSSGLTEVTYDTNYSGSHTHEFSTNELGENVKHNNMPPYVAKYCWERIK